MSRLYLSRDPELAIEELVEHVITRTTSPDGGPLPRWVVHTAVRGLLSMTNHRQPIDAHLNEVIDDLAAWHGIPIDDRPPARADDGRRT